MNYEVDEGLMTMRGSYTGRDLRIDRRGAEGRVNASKAISREGREELDGHRIRRKRSLREVSEPPSGN